MLQAASLMVWGKRKINGDRWLLENWRQWPNRWATNNVEDASLKLTRAGLAIWRDPGSLELPGEPRCSKH